MELRVENKDLQRIAYIRVLAFAANRAAGLGLLNDQPEPPYGFTFDELRRSIDCQEINVNWLKRILPSICTARRLEVELPEPNDTQLTHSDTRFVIRSDEFMKLAGLIELEEVSRLYKDAKDHFAQVATQAETSLGEARKSAVTATQTLVVATRTLWAALATVALAIIVPFCAPSPKLDPGSVSELKRLAADFATGEQDAIRDLRRYPVVIDTGQFRLLLKGIQRIAKVSPAQGPYRPRH